jgi:hypothetical protein
MIGGVHVYHVWVWCAWELAHVCGEAVGGLI